MRRGPMNWRAPLSHIREQATQLRQAAIQPITDLTTAWHDYRSGRRPVSRVLAAAFAFLAELVTLVALLAFVRTLFAILIVSRREVHSIQYQGLTVTTWDPQSALASVLLGALMLPIAVIVLYVLLGFVYNLYYELGSKLLPPVGRPVLLPLFVFLLAYGAGQESERLGIWAGHAYLYVAETVQQAHRHDVVRVPAPSPFPDPF